MLPNPKLEQLPSGRVRLLESFEYRTDWGDKVLIPKDHVSDFASVPRLLQWLVPKVGKWSTPSIIHDYLWGVDKIYSNAVFLDALLAYRVPFRIAAMMYFAVAANAWRILLTRNVRG